MTTNNKPTANLPHYVLKKGKDDIFHTQQEIIQAKKRIPEEYHDFLVLLPQNVKINKVQYKITAEADKLGMFSTQNGTYVSIEKPYMTVDGRVRMARDEHVKLGKRLDIHPPVFQSIADRLLVSVTIESEVFGTSTGIVEVGFGGGVDASNPCANAQTSAIGRALGFMGYGLVGTGMLSSAEEQNAIPESIHPDSIAANEHFQPSTSSNKPISFRVAIVGDILFNQDNSSTVPVMLESRDTVEMVIPILHQDFARSLPNRAVLRVKGWLNNNDNRLRLSKEVPVIENNQAV
ncbi:MULTISPECIES: hypothetical protein [unclassified Sporosarcina]|uniref:hypothetical protein n=1 Tax=unclassified Sporosarcina TaxID=2647733 RepID=UPI001A92FF80|nr:MULTISPECIES: hypothetical protein [unclassified Sporosarcina]MBO0588196.1 hypothetical protein [Sporosarcina sp. E16_8]MBO0601950.1 hypothetical protein [Sporosarcina sp. E16_3]